MQPEGSCPTRENKEYHWNKSSFRGLNQRDEKSSRGISLPALLLYDQLFLSFPVHALDLVLSMHGTSPVRKFFHIHQSDRTVAAGVPCPTTCIMLHHPPLGVGRPAGVKAPVRTLQDITEARHWVLSVLVWFPGSAAEEFIQTPYLLS